MALSSRLGASKEMRVYWDSASNTTTRDGYPTNSENIGFSQGTTGPGRIKEILDHWAVPRHMVEEQSRSLVSGTMIRR